MIFLSHNHKDKQMVELIAQKLAEVFGQDKIFYDSWSIQPGEGIIEKMNDALDNSKFFFFFVSKNSLNSEMVKIEWQNALIKKIKDDIKLIPVKVDDCVMPAVLLQNLYIDIFGKGTDNAIRQIIDVITGKNIYRPGPQTYENIRAYVKENKDDIVIEFRAETYLEPISQYALLLDNAQDEIELKCESDGMFQSGFGIMNNNAGGSINSFLVATLRATCPGFPFVIRLNPKKSVKIKLRGLMRAIKQGEFRAVPIMKNEN